MIPTIQFTGRHHSQVMKMCKMPWQKLNANFFSKKIQKTNRKRKASLQELVK